MPPRDTETARRDAQKKRGTLGPDANLGEAAVTRVRELLDRRGARRGSGSAPSSSRGATRAKTFPRGTARSLSAVDEVPESEKPRRTAKNQASAHNARLLAAASAAADLATNSGKANANTKSATRYSRNTNANTRLEDAIRTCGATAAGTIASLDRAAVAAVAADAHVAAVAAAAERVLRDKKKRTDGVDAVSLVSVDSDADDSEPDEWEDVKGEKHFDAYVALDDDDDDDDDEKRNVSGKSKSVARRVSPADRECLKRMHETHLLCLMARAAATDAAASDPLVKAMAVSAAPRGVAMDPLAEDSPPSTPPTIDRVARLAKWFAGAFECRAFGVAADGTKKDDGVSERRRPRGRDGTGTGTRDRDRKKKKPKPEPVSRRARVKVVDDVIVLDDDDDVVEERDAVNRSDADTTSTSHTRRLLAEACASALVSPRLRLAFACARRRGTQEDLVGLFVAAARGLGFVARVTVAFDPTPHRASKSELAKLGISVGGAEDSSAEVFVSRSSLKRTTKGKRSRSESGINRPAGASLFRLNAVACDPSFFEATAKQPGGTPEDVLARERVSWWAEVLCLETSESEKSENAAARWVPVVPHLAGVSKHAPRWSFKAGGALVDDARALRGAAPYVYAFGDVERTLSTRTDFKTRVVATDVTRKYAEAFSKCAEKRVDAEWVAETTRKVSFSSASSVGRSGLETEATHARLLTAFESNANATDAAEMESRAKTERVPSTMSELKNHPLYACERFLKPNQVIYPRKPVVGFVNGECVFPRSCVSELRSAERWKSEARREVLPDEITKPRAWTHSRASRAALAFAARRDAAESRAAETEDTGRKRGASDHDDDASFAKNEKRRRAGPRSVEEMARDLRRDAEAFAKTKQKAGAETEEDDDARKKRGDIPLFGIWQTREWFPPRAVNGIVPKNERGNVDLIGAHALPPPGTKHVVLPRISRVARAWRDARARASGTSPGRDVKIRPFDFAPALVGFEYQRGGVVVPKFDGVVVCLEEEAGLRARWLESERARIAAEQEKELKKAKRRWRLLLSAIWTRVALRDEFFSVSDAIDNTIDETNESDAEKTTETRNAVNARGVTDPCSLRKKKESALAGPATGLKPGRRAVVAGGADAEVEEM
jgi:xeroderma pigmentosum group C-complementing protein